MRGFEGAACWTRKCAILAAPCGDFLLAAESSLFTVELLYLQLCFGSLLLTIGGLSLTDGAFFTCCEHLNGL